MTCRQCYLRETMGSGWHLFLLADALGVVAAAVLLVAQRPRAAALVAVATSSLCLPLAWEVLEQPTYSPFWRCMATYPPPTGVHYQHVLAECVAGRAAWVRSQLPLVAVPGLLGWVAVAASRARARRTMLALALFGSVPSLALGGALVPAATTWATDDPRWSLAYYEEWSLLGSGAERDLGSICLRFFRLGAPPARDAAEQLAGLRAACLSECAARAAKRPFNPGPVEHACAEQGVVLPPAWTP